MGSGQISGGGIINGGGGGVGGSNSSGGSSSSCCDMSMKCCFYGWLAFSPSVHSSLSPFGCQDDNEGSWSIGIFFGDSPFSLKPIEFSNLSNDDSAAWPVANPVVTCASVSDAGFPSNFVADPFLFIQ
ncbi:glycosyltransferase family protein, partial [Trifolium pratense]